MEQTPVTFPTKHQQAAYQYLIDASRFQRENPDAHPWDLNSDAFRHLESICWLAKDKPGTGLLYLKDFPGDNGYWPTRTFITEWLHGILDAYIGKSEEEIRAAVTDDPNIRYLGRACRFALMDERKRRIRQFAREEQERQKKEELDTAPVYEGDKQYFKDLESGKTPWQGGAAILEWFARNQKQIQKDLSPRLFATMEAIVAGGPTTENIAEKRGVSLQQAREDRRDLRQEIDRRISLIPEWLDIPRRWFDEFLDFLRNEGKGVTYETERTIPMPIRTVSLAELAAMPGMESGISPDKRTSVGRDVTALDDPESEKIFG